MARLLPLLNKLSIKLMGHHSAQSTYLALGMSLGMALSSGVAAQGHGLTLSSDLLGSSRDRGLAGASIAADDGHTAAAINPAFIGVGKGASDSWFAIKQLTFPYVNVSADSLSFTDNQKIFATKPEQLRLEKLAQGPLRKGYVDATVMPSLVVGRVFVGLIMHYEAMLGSRAPFDPDDRSAQTLAVKFRQHLGPMLGFSVPVGPLTLGLSGALLSTTLAEGDFSYDQLDTPKARKAAFAPVSHEYTGQYTMLGLSYDLYDPWGLSLAAVVHNPEGSVFEGTSANSGSYELVPRYQLALAMAPKINSWLAMQGTLQLDHEEGHVTADNLKGGVEWLLGKERNGKKDFAIRLGYNKVGVGFGIKANFGLVAVEFAEDAKAFVADQGPASGITAGFAVPKDPIRRRSLSFTINVADF